jgi:SPP1 family predicted phage head-tail adaptor
MVGKYGKSKLASRLNKRVIIEEVTEATDGAGGYTTSWATNVTVWAEIKPISGCEMIEADKIAEIITHVITIRYVSGITPKMRVNFGGRIFEIQSVVNYLEKKEILELLVREEN